MASSLIRGKFVVVKVESRAEARVITDGAVFQRDGVVVEVGPYAELHARHRPDEVLGSVEHVVVPGFVNGHHHVGLTPLQLGSPDHALELWFASRMTARDVDPYLDTLYSAFEMLESGITTVQHLHGWRIAPAARVIGVAERILKAYEDVGMRVSYSYALRDQNRLAYEADETFAQRFPAPVSDDLAAYLKAQAIPLDDHRGIFTDLWEKCGRNTRDRARIQLAPANLHWCSDEALEALRDWSARYRVGMHMHLVETAYQKEYARRRSGGTALQHLAKLGLVGPQLTLGHGVWLDEADIDMAADSGTMICHNASSNLRLRSGVAPLNHWAARGVRVAIGLDEAGINDDRDMLQEMRLVLRLHRVPGMDDVGQIAHPYLDPQTAVVDAIVQRAKTAGVAMVMVAGEVVVRDGHFTRIDREAALEELAASLRVDLKPEEERRRRLSREVFPVVKRFYDGWLDEGARQPFYRPSSRI